MHGEAGLFASTAETRAAADAPSWDPRSVAEADDARLLAAVATGDQAALGALYDRHAAAAMGLACRVVGDRRTAEEVVQDGFVAVWRRASTYDPARGAGRAWVLAIVHHRAIDRLRGRVATGLEVDILAAADTAAASDVWAEVDARLTGEAISAVLVHLSPEQRAAIELGFFGGFTHVEIAERLGAPLGTVKGRLRLGLARLRSLLLEQAASGAGAWPRRRLG